MTDNLIAQRKRIIRRSWSNKVDDQTNDDDNNAADDLFLSNDQPLPQQRLICVRKKQETLMCSVCEGPAHGYNFNAITCESCKAFFRRNALKSQGKLKCRFENGQCVINITTRKRCKACRLVKCFEKGMRADWILTDEERLNKRQKIEENRRLRQMLYPDSPDNGEIATVAVKTEFYEPANGSEGEQHMDASLLSVSMETLATCRLLKRDLNKIEEIQRVYIDSVRLTSLPPEVPSYPYTARINATSDMVNFPANVQATRLITYFKLLPEFATLNEHDKLILIKYNTFTLTFIRAALNYNPSSDTYHEPNTDDPVFEGCDLIQCFSLYHYERSTRCVRNLLNASMGDRVLLQILLVIILFSKGSAICTYIDEAEPIAEDILTIHRTRNYFVDLLWKYCERKFGSRRTHETFLKLTLSSMDAHLQAYSIRHSCVKGFSVADQLTPLMKSVMLIG